MTMHTIMCRLLTFLFALLMATAINIDDLLSSLSLESKIGQMVQIDIAQFMIQGTDQVNDAAMKAYIQQYQIGSILNSPFSGPPINGVSGWTASQWRDLLHNITLYSSTLTDSKIPILYGIDSIHGATFIRNAALMPQALNLAASFNPSLAYTAGKITSKDTRAGGIPWIFSPVLGLGIQPLWARFPETFGEDPYLVGQLGAAIIEGLQYDWNADYSDSATDGFPRQTAACMKHFIAYSMPSDGHDRTPVQLPDRLVKQLYVPQFQAAIDAGVMTAMESYQEVGGVPMVSSKDYLKTLLRKEMNFTQGFMVTDYAEIENLHNWHMVSATVQEAVQLAMTDTTIDMSMVPLDTSFYDNLLSLVQSGVIPMSRIDESVRRILLIKDQLGMFDHPIIDQITTEPLLATVGQAIDWETSLNASRESITLVKNVDSLLPLAIYQEDGTTKKSVFLTGPTCNSTISQTGGWAIHWQGVYYEHELGIDYRKSVLDGLTNDAFYGQSNVNFYPGVSLDAENITAIDQAYVAASVNNADYIIACLGEGSYAEKPGDINDLALPQGQVDYVTYLASLGKPVVLVMIEGRPRLIHNAVEVSQAVVLAYQPGPVGGQAIAEVLTGKINPSGRLPFTYPSQQSTMIFPYHHKTSDQCTQVTGYHTAGYVPCPIEFAFGDGLSYTSFAYSNLVLSSTLINELQTLNVSVTVKNTGNRAGQHTVMLFLYDMYRRVTPEYKLLKRFTKIYLAAGEPSTVSFILSAKDLAYYGVEGHSQVESGAFSVGLHPSVDCRSSNTQDYLISTADTSSATDQPMCSSFTLQTSDDYYPVCDRGCALWTEKANGGICGRTVDGGSDSGSTCRSTCIKQQWDWSYIDCITNNYQESSCQSIDDMQCYDAFAMVSPSSTDDCSSSNKNNNDDNEYSMGIVILIGVLTGVAGILIGAGILYVIVAKGYLAVGKASAMNRPLLNYAQLKAEDMNTGVLQDA